jgi:tetratricopeptide (TPR) repeat protein
MLGSLTHRLGSMATVTIQLFRKALEMKPDDEKAMAGLARALFSSENYDEAIEYYERLLLLKPDSKNYTLSLAYSLINVNRHEEAKKHLYKLQYLYPEDQYVNRGLAQVLTSLDQFEQAEKLYEQLTTVDNPQSDDLLDYGFCLWYDHKIDAAVNIFKQYVKNKRDTDADLEKVFLTLRADQLSQHQISTIEIYMMLDAVLRF